MYRIFIIYNYFLFIHVSLYSLGVKAVIFSTTKNNTKDSLGVVALSSTLLARMGGL